MTQAEEAMAILNPNGEPCSLVDAAREIVARADASFALLEQIGQLKAENERLMRGEFICRKCGIRKNDTHPKCDF
jgi:hypothetical protein